ncbi:transposase, IS4 family protein [mine drainage metagenome]|uniref:Transposase, IS4 family protein n=1 Tax=mine drainage metagenome TaxID=410659 RepID=T0ZJQ8_9ZZZZ
MGRWAKPDIDWQDPKARQDLLNEIVRDGHAAVAATRELLAAGKEDAAVTEAVDLLARVVEQDIEPVEGADEVRIRQGVAKDRVVSTTDPEMRHGHKTSSGRFDGAKVNATLDEDSQLITDVGVIKGNESDSIAVMPALEREERLEILPRELMGDHAYGVMPLRPQVAGKGDRADRATGGTERASGPVRQRRLHPRPRCAQVHLPERRSGQADVLAHARRGEDPQRLPVPDAGLQHLSAQAPLHPGSSPLGGRTAG